MPAAKTQLSSLPSDLWGYIGFYLNIQDVVKLIAAGNAQNSFSIRHGVRNCGADWFGPSYAPAARMARALHVLPKLEVFEMTLPEYERIIHPTDWTNLPPNLKKLTMEFAHCIESLCSIHDLDSILPSLEYLHLTNSAVPITLVRTIWLRKLPSRLLSLHLKSRHPSCHIDLSDTTVFPKTLLELVVELPPVVARKGNLKFDLPLLRVISLNMGHSICQFDVKHLPPSLTSITLIPQDSLKDIKWKEIFPDLTALVLLPSCSEKQFEGSRLLVAGEDEYVDAADQPILTMYDPAPISPSMEHFRGLLIDDIQDITRMNLLQTLSVPGVWIGKVDLPPKLVLFESSYIVMESLPKIPNSVHTIKCNAILGLLGQVCEQDFLESLEIENSNVSDISPSRERKLFPSNLTKLTCTEYTIEKFAIEMLPRSLKALDARFGWNEEVWQALAKRKMSLPNLTFLRDRAMPHTTLPSCTFLPLSLRELDVRIDGTDVSQWPFGIVSGSLQLSSVSRENTILESEEMSSIELENTKISNLNSMLAPSLTRLTIHFGLVSLYMFTTLPKTLLHLNIGSVKGNICEEEDPTLFCVRSLPQTLLTLSIGYFEVTSEQWPEISKGAAMALPQTLRKIQIESGLLHPLGLQQGLRLGVTLILLDNDISTYQRRNEAVLPLEPRYSELFPTPLMYC